MIIPCPIGVPCLDPADPVQNFSSEAPDVDHFFAVGSGSGSLFPGPGRNWNTYQCNTIWGPVICYGITQEDALACLEALQWECNPINTTLFPNELQTCTYQCVTGGITNLASFTVQPGMFHALTQDEANSLAYQYACLQAKITGQTSFNCSDGSFWNTEQDGLFVCPNGTVFTAITPAHTFSNATQELADQMAISYANLQAMATAMTNIAQCFLPQDPTKPAGDPTIFWNRTQSAVCPCPDGTFFTYTVPPFRFAGSSQSMADGRAQSYAIQQAHQHLVCLSPLFPAQTCARSPYVASITATGNNLSATTNRWTIVSGRLPDGLSLNNGLTFGGTVVAIAGIPTEGGQFNFTLRCQTPVGDFMQKAYTLCVVDFAIALGNDFFPDGTVNQSYSSAFAANDCATPPLSWQVVSGALPPGLTLDEQTGVVSGTPTQQGTFSVTVQLQTQAT